MVNENNPSYEILLDLLRKLNKKLEKTPRIRDSYVTFNRKATDGSFHKNHHLWVVIS